MTTCYESNQGILTNNSSEAYNSRMKKRLGDHCDLPTFIRKLIKEHSQVRKDWLQRDKPTATRARCPQLRLKFQQREKWEVDLKTRISVGIMGISTDLK